MEMPSLGVLKQCFALNIPYAGQSTMQFTAVVSHTITIRTKVELTNNVMFTMRLRLNRVGEPAW